MCVLFQATYATLRVRKKIAYRRLVLSVVGSLIPMGLRSLIQNRFSLHQFQVLYFSTKSVFITLDL